MKHPRARIESQHSNAFAEWVRINLVTIPDLKWCTHWPNEGLRDRMTVVRKGVNVTFSPSGVAAKRMGAKKGLLDFFLFVPRGQFVGMAFEMKSPDGELTKEQAEWSEHLSQTGWHCPSPYIDWEVAARAVLAYLALPKPSTTPQV